MLTQLSNFIDQFRVLIVETDINVISDSVGNLSIDVPTDMSKADSTHVVKKLGVIDRLINSQGCSINDAFQKGLEIEKQLMIEDPNYKSVLGDKISKFKELNELYKH
jgi:hypothetical protein